jgi:hypothetical protein
MQLFFKHLKGSGYDVATALENKSIQYQITSNQRAHWEKVALPKVLEKSYLLYLGEKQISSTEVVRYRNLKRDSKLVQSVSQLSESLLNLSSEEQLINWMAEHEEITGRLIQQESHRKKRFPALQGGFKSLGAWGGDFAWIMPKKDDLSYLRQMGYHEIFPFAELLSI